MNDFQLRLVSEALIVSDNKKSEIINKLICLKYDKGIIDTYENIVSELLIINDCERALGLRLTPLNGEKTSDELEEEKSRLDIAKELGDQEKSDVENYIFLSNIRTTNNLSRISTFLEKQNSEFLNLFDAIEERYEMNKKLNDYNYEDKKTILEYYDSMKKNNNSNDYTK